MSVIHGDCLAVMADMPDNSVDLIVADPPYFRVKDEPWDRQWAKPEGFLAWIGEVAAQWQRILKPNGSLYCFASPQMGARVEVALRDKFDVLNHIVWEKERDRGKHAASCKETLRGYFPNTERIIFAEHYGADNIAKGEAGYAAKCDELRGFVFEPLRSYLDGERERAGWSVRRVAEEYQKVTGSRTVTGMAGHWFGQVQWALPTEQNYIWLRSLFAGDFLKREYDDLKREYDDLRQEFEALRRPFAVTADVPYTDVWTFPTVGTYKGKHPCEKPQAMLRHIIAASSRTNAVVLDPFAGSGSTGEAAISLGRQFIGIEMSDHWVATANERIAAAQGNLFAESR
jgi:adenine-specific DNA-methyltransferase